MAIVVSAAGRINSLRFGNATIDTKNKTINPIGFNSNTFGTPTIFNGFFDFNFVYSYTNKVTNFHFSLNAPITAVGGFDSMQFGQTTNIYRAAGWIITFGIAPPDNNFTSTFIANKNISGYNLNYNLQSIYIPIDESKRLDIYWGSHPFYPIGFDSSSFGLATFPVFLMPSGIAPPTNKSIFVVTRGNMVFYFTQPYTSKIPNFHFSLNAPITVVGGFDSMQFGQTTHIYRAAGWIDVRNHSWDSMQFGQSTKVFNNFYKAWNLSIEFNSTYSYKQTAQNVGFYFWIGTNAYPSGIDSLHFGNSKISFKIQKFSINTIIDNSQIYPIAKITLPTQFIKFNLLECFESYPIQNMVNTRRFFSINTTIDDSYVLNINSFALKDQHLNKPKGLICSTLSKNVYVDPPTHITSSYDTSWNTYFASVMRDTNANYITNNYVKSWGIDGYDTVISNTNNIKFGRIIRTNKNPGVPQWRFITNSINEYNLIDGFAYRSTRNIGNDWTGIHNNNDYLDITDNYLFSHNDESGFFNQYCKNPNDGFWVVVKPSAKSQNVSGSPQMNIIGYTFDPPFHHDSIENTSSYSVSNTNIITFSERPDLEYNAKNMSVDFSLFFDEKDYLICNNAFKNMVLDAALKLNLNNYNGKWLDNQNGLQILFFDFSNFPENESLINYISNMMDSNINDLFYNSIAGNMELLFTDDFSLPNEDGEFYLLEPKILGYYYGNIILNITHALICSSNIENSSYPFMILEVGTDYSLGKIQITQTVIDNDNYTIYLKELSFKFKIGS